MSNKLNHIICNISNSSPKGYEVAQCIYNINPKIFIKPSYATISIYLMLKVQQSHPKYVKLSNIFIQRYQMR